MTPTATLFLFLLQSPAWSQGILAPRDGAEGQPMEIQAVQDGEPIRGLALQGTWWPQARDSSLSRAGTTDARGEVAWVPNRGGVVAIEGEGFQRLIRVQPAAPPTTGWATLIVALLLPLVVIGALLRPVSRRWLAGRTPAGRVG